MMNKKTWKLLTSGTGAAIGALMYVLCKFIVLWIVPPIHPEYYTFWDASDTVWTIVFAVGGGFVGNFYYAVFFSNRVQKIFDAIGSYDVTEKSLTILKRSATFKDFIAVEPVLYLDQTYNEPTLVYTGATVGGVSMGGFHVEGGDYDTQIARSGKYRLVYINPSLETRNPIEQIVLPSNLVDIARNDIVLRKFLKNNTLVLFYDVELDQLMSNFAKSSLASGDMAKALSAAQRAYTTKQLTKEDCKYIRDWLLCR